MLKLHPFDVQLIGAIVIHRGKLAEMGTGEGKTLTAVFPAYLNALGGKGVHILTFNDYLARRDAGWMGEVYNFLGLKVGFIQEGMSTRERQEAYNADITYLTAKEAGFDFLRDSLCYSREKIVHRDFNYAIVDEADSILIDEARVPLIIAGGSEDYVADTYYLAKISRDLEENQDYQFDEYGRNVYLTDDGLKRVERILNCPNLYDDENIETLSRLNYALHAEYLLHRDVDYIVRKGVVELVDEFTGRVADKRRWPDGLQAAVEAKENIAIGCKGNILNSITLQHFLRLYPKISGMTATAQSAEKEFRQFYDLHTVVIPPNKPCIRKDHQDIIYLTKEAKKRALIEETIRVHKSKRPILVGTQSVEESATLADTLNKRNIKCVVLNAKRDEFEARIVAQAGKLGAVTISTNMAGRGTDIRLGAGDENEKREVAALGGLYVIGTNKHESERIDNQLRGRAGRQGDPGSSRFFISLEDDLFVKYKLKDLLPPNYTPDQRDNPHPKDGAHPSGRINNPIVINEINRTQRIVEGQNLEIKKTIYTYSSLIEEQRKILFAKRNNIVSGKWVHDFFESNSPDKFNEISSKIDPKKLDNICKHISLYYTDKSWSQYLADIAEVREGIHYTRIGGQAPVLEFHKLAVKIFDELQNDIEDDMIRSFNDIKMVGDNIDLEEAGLKAPSATWTYLINDNPFEEMLGMKLIGNIGLSIGAGLYWPLLALYFLLNKFGKKNKSR